MGGQQMEGDNRERRKMAKEAHDHDKTPSEIGATLGASKQRQKAPSNASHEERLLLKREGKTPSVAQNTPVAKPRDREGDGERDRYPRL